MTAFPDDNSMSSSSQDVIQGRKLGEGGFGKVVEGKRDDDDDSCREWTVCFSLGTYRGRTVAVKMPLRKEDFEEALVEFKKLRNFRHRNVVEAIAYCKEPAMFGENHLSSRIN
jgi:serine/threonine protein kinase